MLWGGDFEPCLPCITILNIILFQIPPHPEELLERARGTSRRAMLLRKELELVEACRKVGTMSVANFMHSIITICSNLSRHKRDWFLELKFFILKKIISTSFKLQTCLFYHLTVPFVL